ncbi:uncharacterized protein N7483_012487 [Penicillium malachiteum]|uniref:uncharacterized protein n=1 Tax=Penicillium malachiteum TaxID=1324776 RepID=UPI00254898AC|nr:uncharacterized protein N7483_012487 [Penicillium malachiteum]KAJ5715306.1 hypothetical protein N7483_012487 [Penicillium malachiteum]
MGNWTLRIPRPSKQPPPVDFIENRLPSHHAMFSGHQNHYDPSTENYVPNRPLLTSSEGLEPPKEGSGKDSEQDEYELPPRPAVSDTKAMARWAAMFPSAMATMIAKSTPPHDRANASYNIRDRTNWEMVCEVLEAARDKYQQEGGPVRWFRKVRRKAADHIIPIAEAAQIASNVVPNNPYSTPVLASVVIVLDAMKTAAKVRNQVLAGFDGLVHLFSDVELFLGTFPKDDNIKSASLDLTVSALEAVEKAITFFISNEFMRGGKALLMGGQYEQDLRQSLNEINIKSGDLMREAAKSHIYEFAIYSEQTKGFYKEILEASKSTLDGINSIKDMFSEHTRLVEEQNKRMEKKVEQIHWELQERDYQLHVAQEEITYLKIRNGHLLPSREPSPMPQAQIPFQQSWMNQEMWRGMLETGDVDLADTALVTAVQGRLSQKERAQAERVIHTAPFKNWIIVPQSAKLLVQWDPRPSKTIRGVSPLSVVGKTIAQALQANPRFLFLSWHGGIQVDRAGNGHPGDEHAMICSLIDQLLRQHEFDMRYVPMLDHSSASQDDWLEMLATLLRQIPGTRTVCCLIDGVSLLERDEFAAEALPVLGRLIALVDEALAIPLKLLFTSTPGVTVVRAAFEDEGSIINVAALPRSGLVASQGRVFRELGQTIEGNEGRSGWN